MNEENNATNPDPLGDAIDDMRRAIKNAIDRANYAKSVAEKELNKAMAETGNDRNTRVTIASCARSYLNDIVRQLERI